jgi:hypothetical protein
LAGFVGCFLWFFCDCALCFGQQMPCQKKSIRSWRSIIACSIQHQKRSKKRQKEEKLTSLGASHADQINGQDEERYLVRQKVGPGSNKDRKT